jgi:hypothetical protein
MREFSQSAIKNYLTVVALTTLFLTACKKNDQAPQADGTLPPEMKGLITDIQGIRALGFSPVGMQITEDGYRVEGDIVITRASLDQLPASAREHNGQYSTQYKIALAGSARTINIGSYVSNATFQTSVAKALDSTIADLNNLKLPLLFKHVTDTSTADVIVEAVDLGGDDGSGVTLGQDGEFVNPQGNPGKYITLNSNPAAALNTQSQIFLSQILDHEFGHCIGLRHTDYQDRLYSGLLGNGTSPTYANQLAVVISYCKQYYPSFSRYTKAKQASIEQAVFNALFAEPKDAGDYSAATHLYGTPVSATFSSSSPVSDPNSLMLAFIQTAKAHPFDGYDIIALFDLYGNANQTKFIKSHLSTNGTITNTESGKYNTISDIAAAVKTIK